jgi:UDP-glucose 4-epimerase
MAHSEKVLVTGGAGFIGSHLVEALVADGSRVVVFDDFSTGLARNLETSQGSVDIVEGDVRDLAALRSVTKGVGIVFHLAAMPAVAPSIADPLACGAINVGGTLHVLVAAREAGVRRVVFTSSAAVYGADPTLPKTETLPTSPLSPYAASKLAGEEFAHAFSHVYGIETAILRLFNVYGPRQNPESEDSGVITRFLSRLAAGEAPLIDGDGQQSRDFVFVSDVVAAFLRAANAPETSGEVFNIGSGRSTTINELATALTSTMLPGSYLRPMHRAARVCDVRHSCADITKAKSVLKFEPTVNLRDGLAKTVAWWREEWIGR